MKKIHLDNGLLLEVDEKFTNDMELFEDLSEVEGGNFSCFPKVVNRILTPENKKKVYDHVRVDGHVPVDAMVKIVTEILDKLGPKGKNS